MTPPKIELTSKSQLRDEIRRLRKERDDAMAATGTAATELAALRQRAEAAEAALAETRQRYEVRRDDAMCAYGCESPSYREAALSLGWDGADETAFAACLQRAWLAHVRECPRHPQRRVEAALAAERDLKLTAYAKLDAVREVVKETIIPALEAFQLAARVDSGGAFIAPPAFAPAVRDGRAALAAARKTLED